MKKYSDHKKKWKHCKLCPLSKVRTNIVLARGKVPADIVFIGEAPGVSEDAIGKPFIGPAGHLLDQMVKASGLNKLRLLFTNMVACIPLEQKRTSTIHTPPEESVIACGERLREIIDIAQPKALVCVGRTSQLHAQKILKCKTTDFIWCDIIHPAHILRNKHIAGLKIQETVETLKELAKDV